MLSDICGLKSQLESRQGHNKLSEILFVGSTNVGKSSLLTKLLNPPKADKKKRRDLPNVSKKKGFTKTLNFYTVGNSFRLVDSPGYGFKSNDHQGTIVNEYLENYSSSLRQAFILAHAVKGLTPHDAQVASMLTSLGIPYDLVLTKADMVKETDGVHQVLADAQELTGIVSRVYLTSVTKDIGINLLRGGIWRSVVA